MSHSAYQCSGCERPFHHESRLDAHESTCSAMQARRRVPAPQMPLRTVPKRAARFTPSKRPIGTMRRQRQPPTMALNNSMVPSSTADVQMGDFSTYDTTDIDVDPSVEEDCVQPEPVLSSSGRPQREHRLPAKARYIRDVLPEDEFLLDEERAPASVPAPDPVPPPASLPRRVLWLANNVRLHLTETVRSLPNVFGLSRFYFGNPLSSKTPAAQATSSSSPVTTSYAPYPNKSAWLLGSYYHATPTKSQSDFKSLVDTILDPDFNRDDIRGVPWLRINRDLAQTGEDSGELGRGWQASTVNIRVPTGVKKKSARGRSGEPTFVEFAIPAVHHRSITSVMDQVRAHDTISSSFQDVPYQQHWQPHNDKWTRERVHSELYSSDLYIDAYNTLQDSAREPGCTAERVMDAILLGSDSMLLADFGHASLWPVYAWYGNQSKYDRARPSMDASHAVAYIEKLPENISVFLEEHRKTHGKKKNAALLAHLRRELFHACLALILEKDPALMEAYKHGRLIKGVDGVTRRHYPRFFNYSADYPEKALLATIRDMGSCPCPRCLVKKTDLWRMGTASDMATRTEHLREDSAERQGLLDRARNFVFKLGYAVASRFVENELSGHSWTLTQNAFSWLLAVGAPSIFRMLRVDLMHEFELGVWKALFAHLIRILHTQGYGTIVKLNQRYREVPTFGNAIRRFPESVADMSRMAAHDFEDLLQCAIPCFAGLFPDEVDEHVRVLLFRAMEWHALAAMRMHTDSSVRLLHNATIQLGTALRHFRDVICPQFATVETPSEVQKRQRAAARASAAGTNTRISNIGTPRPKTFSLDTFKFHSLGDYAATICEVGTTDSITTRTGELAHRKQKQYYERTSKKDFTKQIVARSNQQEALRELRQAHDSADPTTPQKLVDEEDLVGNPKLRYFIAKDQSSKVLYGQFQAQNGCDAAVQDFVPKLLHHCAERLLEAYSGPPHQLTASVVAATLAIEKGVIYSHQTVRFNYTTYDVRRAQSYVEIDTDKVDVLLLPEDDDDDGDTHPFRYARVQRIYHARLKHDILCPVPQRFNILFVRWFRSRTEWDNSWDRCRLDKVSFIPASDDGAFGFVDPARVLRGVHLCPAFEDGLTTEYIGPSQFRPKEGDYIAHYVLQFSDRDLAMRYYGLGVGHVNVVPRILKQRSPPVKMDPEPDPPEPQEPVQTTPVVTASEGHSQHSPPRASGSTLRQDGEDSDGEDEGEESEREIDIDDISSGSDEDDD